MNENTETKALIAEFCDLQKQLVELNVKQKEELAHIIELYFMGEIPHDIKTCH